MNDKSDNLRIAIVGCGQIADAHLQEKRQTVGQHARNTIIAKHTWRKNAAAIVNLACKGLRLPHDTDMVQVVIL
jgi:hypothetical protein